MKKLVPLLLMLIFAVATVADRIWQESDHHHTTSSSGAESVSDHHQEQDSSHDQHHCCQQHAICCLGLLRMVDELRYAASFVHEISFRHIFTMKKATHQVVPRPPIS